MSKSLEGSVGEKQAEINGKMHKQQTSGASDTKLKPWNLENQEVATDYGQQTGSQTQTGEMSAEI